MKGITLTGFVMLIAGAIMVFATSLYINQLVTAIATNQGVLLIVCGLTFCMGGAALFYAGRLEEYKRGIVVKKGK